MPEQPDRKLKNLGVGPICNLGPGSGLLDGPHKICLARSMDISYQRAQTPHAPRNRDPLSGCTYSDRGWTTQDPPRHHGKPLSG